MGCLDSVSPQSQAPHVGHAQRFRLTPPHQIFPDILRSARLLRRLAPRLQIQRDRLLQILLGRGECAPLRRDGLIEHRATNQLPTRANTAWIDFMAPTKEPSRSQSNFALSGGESFPVDALLFQPVLSLPKGSRHYGTELFASPQPAVTTRGRGESQGCCHGSPANPCGEPLGGNFT